LRRNCLLKLVIEGNIEGKTEVTGRRGRRHKQPLDDLKENTEYCKLREDALYRHLWRTRFGRGNGPVVRKTTVGMTTKFTNVTTGRITRVEGPQTVHARFKILTS
jgi:hypothetical protein